MLVEYYEFLGRVAFRYGDMIREQNEKKGLIKPEEPRQERYIDVKDFLNRLIERQIELGNLKKKT